eukprot:12541-Heterococcus_DN1.PRE.2
MCTQLRTRAHYNTLAHCILIATAVVLLTVYLATVLAMIECIARSHSAPCELNLYNHYESAEFSTVSQLSFHCLCGGANCQQLPTANQSPIGTLAAAAAAVAAGTAYWQQHSDLLLLALLTGSSTVIRVTAAAADESQCGVSL